MILFTYQTVPCVTTSLIKISENLKKFHPLIRFKKQQEQTNKQKTSIFRFSFALLVSLDCNEMLHVCPRPRGWQEMFGGI